MCRRWRCLWKFPCPDWNSPSRRWIAPLLSRLASETLGTSLNLAEAREKLPNLITSAAKIIPIQSDQPLWNAPLGMALFVMLILAEWIIRKVHGML
jgi:hypothetical protein